MTQAAVVERVDGEAQDAHDAIAQHTTGWCSPHDPAERIALVLHYLPHARRLAAMAYASRAHDDLPFEDYVQLARLGLVESVDRFDPQRGVRFTTFSTKRIQGAIVDGLARASERSSQVARLHRLRRERLDAVTHEASDRHAGRADEIVGRSAREAGPEHDGRHEDEHQDAYASDPEHALEAVPVRSAVAPPGSAPVPSSLPSPGMDTLIDLGIGYALGLLLEGTGMLDAEAWQPGDGTGHAPSPEQLCGQRQESDGLRRQLLTALDLLTPRQQAVLRGHYLQGLSFTDIAGRLGLSRGRITQLHLQALRSLRRLLSPASSPITTRSDSS